MMSQAPRRRRWWNRPRFDALELVLVGLLISVSAMGFLRHHARNPELQHLRDQYGPAHFSEGPEEWAIRDFFGDRPGGFFVDIGANHYKSYSKTYFLESKLGWSGLAVEPQQKFAADYAAHRPRTKFLPFFISDASNEQAKMYVLWWNTTVTSGDKAFVERHGPSPSEVSATTITLNDLFVAERVERIDFLSMDIELWEPKALAGFDIERYQPELVCIEALPSVRQFILDYFGRHGYVVIGKYLRADDQNLYFSRLQRRE
jgi:FkbM family methyltransferase